jgi:hypothetical protein
MRPDICKLGSCEEEIIELQFSDAVAASSPTRQIYYSLTSERDSSVAVRRRRATVINITVV